MTRKDFIEIAKNESIDDSLYCFDEVYRDNSFVLKYEGSRWVTYYCERGGAHFKKYYNSESDALKGLLERFQLMRKRRETW